MPEKPKKLYNRKWITFLTLYCGGFLALFLIAYNTELNHWIDGVLSIFRPVLLGLVFAYVANPAFRFYERKLFSRLRPAGLRRTLSLLCTYLTLFLIVTLLLLMILPQMISAITTFITNYQSYVDSAVVNINGIFDALNSVLSKFVKKGDFFQHINDTQFFDVIYKLAVDFLENLDISNVTDTASSLIGIVTDTIFALFISLYLLSTKEKRYAQIMKLRTAIFSSDTNRIITRLCSTADHLFGEFFKGKFVDSVIVGILLYVCFLLFNIPFAILIAAFIAITNIIPLIGFVIGAIPSVLIVLLTDPEKIFPFLLILFIIFQIDSNILSPRILGSNTGISSLCVIIAICVAGRMWGIPGMLLGVPLFATILDFSDHLIHRRLQKKRLPDDVENYYAPDPIIDPLQHPGTEMATIVRIMEKRILKANKLIDLGKENELTRADRTAISVHKFMRRFRFIPETPHDILTQFSAENAERQVRIDVENQLRQRNIPSVHNHDHAEEGGNGQ